MNVKCERKFIFEIGGITYQYYWSISQFLYKIWLKKYSYYVFEMSKIRLPSLKAELMMKVK